MKKNNRGFTLIEVLVSLAILAVVGGSVAGFMSISSKNYVSVNKEVNIQYESQIAINQIKDLIIDANKGVSYGLEPVSGAFTLIDVTNQNSETELLAQLHAANPANVNKVKRCLLIYNETLKDDGTYEYPVVKIVWNPDTQNVYYADKTYALLTDLEADPYLLSVPEADYKLLAEYTSNFSVDLFHLKDSRVDLKVTFANQGKEYETTPTVALRNKVVVGDDLRKLYNNNNVTKPNLALRVIIKKAGVDIKQDNLLIDEEAEYTAEVEMQFGATSDNAVTWSLEGSNVPTGKNASSVDGTGKVTISPDETATTLVLKATSAKLVGQPGIVNITVDRIDNTKGYVRSVTLGEQMITVLEGSQATGIYKIGYQYNFQDQAPYIMYVNETKVEKAERGVVWSVKTTAPADSYTFNQTNGELIVSFAAQKHPFVITATAKIPKPGLTLYASDSKTVTPDNLSEKPKEPDVEIVTDTSLDRNGNNEIKVNVSEFIVPSYRWKITGYSSNFAPANENNGQSYPENCSRENVTLLNPTSKSPSIKVDTKLDWDTEFWIELTVTVTETASSGGDVKQVSETIKLYLGKVSAKIETPDGTVMRRNATEKRVDFNLSNYKNYEGDIEATITLYKIDGTFFQSRNITANYETEEIRWSYHTPTDTLTVKLSENGRKVLKKNTPKKDQFTKMIIQFKYNNRYTGDSFNKDIKPIYFTFEY